MESALVQEIKYQNPLDLFAPFTTMTWSLLFHSSKNDKESGRYSFIAIDPFLTLTSKNNRIKLQNNSQTGNPFSILQQQMQHFPLSNHSDLPPFQGGAAGYLGYDLCQRLEQIPPHKKDDIACPDMAMGFYDLVMAFDHSLMKAWIFSCGYPEQDSKKRKKRAQQRSQWLLNHIEKNSYTPTFINDSLLDKDIKTNFSQTKYQQTIQKIIDYIVAGDVYQVNLSQRFSAKMSKSFSAFQLYSKVMQLNPAPFSGYFHLDSITIASASPERFLKLEHGKVETHPIKGTRPRGKTIAEDLMLANELSHSAKDKAENLMIVDLLRNDLARVCRPHSIQVTQLCQLESHATVHHLVSTIIGELKSNKDAVDLLIAAFPGGSVTGAPKIRAMKIIAELEPTARGPYCGSFCYLGFNGAMDSSILIRTFVFKDQMLYFQAGGGIVADSDPQQEYLETLDKVRGLRQALLLSE